MNLIDVEAEIGVLGCLICDTGAYDRLPDGLRSDHFGVACHQLLFQVLVTTIESGSTPTAELLGHRFDGHPDLAGVSGRDWMNQVAMAAPVTALAREYGKRVQDLSVRRSLSTVASDITSTVGDADRTSDELLEEAEAALFNVAERGDRSQAIATFGDTLTGALALAQAAYQRGGKLTGLSTGLVDLDQKLGGLHPTDLLILAGRPSMGKTALATNIAFNAAKTGAAVLFFSAEMSKEQLGLRILADITGVSSDKVRKGDISESDFRKLADACDDFQELALHTDETGGLHIGKLCARARRHKRRLGRLDLIVVDYLQLLTTDATKGGNRVQEVSKITGALKALAKELSVPILALSQLSRQVESREDKRPMLSDLRESGSIEQDADAVMFVFRESYYLERSEPQEGSEAHMKWQDNMSRCANQAEVIIGKQRHGPIGTVRLAFDSDKTRFGTLPAAPPETLRYAGPQ